MTTSKVSTEKTTHTPGPWHVSPLDGRTCGPSRLVVQSGTTISQMQAVAIVTLRTGETDANARLITAAPDLLAVLKWLVDDYEKLCGDGITVDTEPSVLTAAHVAIAKAEGGQS